MMDEEKNDYIKEERPGLMVYDAPEEEGIDLEFQINDGMFLKVAMKDEDARNLISIIDNKIIARGK